MCFCSENARNELWQDIFDIVWDAYRSEIQTNTAKMFDTVPVKNGEIANGWFCTYGDGNEKIKRERCQWPLSLGKIEQKNETINCIDRNVFKCENCPIQANQYSQKYITCIHHTYLMKNHGVELKDINNYITYIQCIETLQQSKSDKIKDDMRAKLAKFKLIQIKRFDTYTQLLVSKLSNDCQNQTDHITPFKQVLLDEIINDDEIDNLGGCRKAENISKQSNFSGGSIAVMNCTGMILTIDEISVRETPSFVIQYLYNAFTRNESMTEYYERIECLGLFLFCHFWRVSS